MLKPQGGYDASSWTDRLDQDDKSTTGKLRGRRALYDADAEVHKLYEGAAVPAIEAAFPARQRTARWTGKNQRAGGARSRP